MFFCRRPVSRGACSHPSPPPVNSHNIGQLASPLCHLFTRVLPKRRIEVFETRWAVTRAHVGSGGSASNKGSSGSSGHDAGGYIPAYPSTNPTHWGWKYQGVKGVGGVAPYLEFSRVVSMQGKGQGERVERLVTLRTFPTTGTLCTHMDHPRMGNNLMFRKNLTEQEFVEVLMNPRAHGKGSGGYRRRSELKRREGS